MKRVLLFVVCICAVVVAAVSARGSTAEEHTYDCGTSLYIEASPAEGYHFVSWSDGNTDNPREVSVLSNIAFDAVFALDDPGLSTALDEVNDSGTSTGKAEPQKILHNGQILILRDGKAYTVHGQEVR
jgi:hypothetical protein